MIQGTASNAGKSLLAAGLCRILRQDGLRVAPFKSQNMALNSYVTADGLEMGRAQVMQAECAGIEPDVRMNPILLKPNSDTGSQVIVGGEVVGNMHAREYFAYKHSLLPKIREAYASLASEYDVIVLEGAGSPAEINLKDGDIVNMGMARMAGAPVLLAGDINPGGVFASLAGTMLLLDEEERRMVKGVIINKFRGDIEILRPGLGRLEEIIDRPVVGVVPWMELDVDDEDSLSERLVRRRDCPVDVAVIRLPRMSNFTDFAPLESAPGVGVRYVGSAGALGAPDMIILPGTKSTMADLVWLRECGLEARIMAHAAAGKPVWGICGGYQMLGAVLRDPDGVEGGGTLAGLGLLELETTFMPGKRRARVEGVFCVAGGSFAQLRGARFSGYEIHMGESAGSGPPLCEIREGAGVRPDGMAQGNVCGTYVHGIFDEPWVWGGVARALLERKGLRPEDIKSVGPKDYKRQQYDLFAQKLRESLDMEKIYGIMEAGVG